MSANKPYRHPVAGTACGFVVWMCLGLGLAGCENETIEIYSNRPDAGVDSDAGPEPDPDGPDANPETPQLSVPGAAADAPEKTRR